MAIEAMSEEELNGQVNWENRFVPGSEVQPASLDLVGSGLFLRNNLNLLYGKQGLGKSTLATWLASEIGGRVVWLTREEDPATTAERLEVSGGSRDDIWFLPAEESLWPSFELATDPGEFKDAMKSLSPAMIVLDPAARFLGRGIDDNLEGHVRPPLERLSEIAITCKATIIVIRHENKHGAGIDQVMGAGAWSAVPRCATRLYAEKGILYAERVKCNQAPPLPRMPAHLVSMGNVARFELLEGEAARLAMGTTTAEEVGKAALELLGGDDYITRADAERALPGRLRVTWNAVRAHLGESTYKTVNGKSTRVYRRDRLENIAAGQDWSGSVQDFEECSICGATHAPWIDCGDDS